TQVYARPVELHPGLPQTSKGFEQELKRLGYRGGNATQPGSYLRRGSHFEILTRKAQFADGWRDPVRVRVALDSGGIASLRDAEGRDLADFRLDPLLIG